MNQSDEEIKTTEEEKNTSKGEDTSGEDTSKGEKTSEEEKNTYEEEKNTSEEEENTSEEEENTSEEKVNTSDEGVDLPEEETDSSVDEISPEIEEEFEEEIKFEKEAPAASEEELRLRMKMRILKSYKWQEDIIIPFSKELEISPEELEDILMKRLDMSSLEALQPRFESSRLRCTKEKIHSDLKLCWLSDVMDLLTEEETEQMKNKVAFKIFKEDKSYEEALEEGRKELVEYLKR
jgi:energy-converting hydrogenase A subunit M